jgi:SET domain
MSRTIWERLGDPFSEATAVRRRLQASRNTSNRQAAKTVQSTADDQEPRRRHSRRTMRILRRLCPAVLVQVILFRVTHGLAVSSRTSSSGGGTGFGASKTAWKVHTTDDSRETQRLIQVLSSFPGAEVSNVEIGFSPSENGSRRGLFAAKHVNKGKVICKVPSDCALAMSAPTAAGDDAVPATLNPAEVGANFWNMYYNNPGAREQWSWYLDTLPDVASFALDSTPDCWARDEIALLEFPRAVRQALQRKEQVEQVSAELGIDLQSLQYATWLASSRGFSIALSADGTTANKEEEVPRDERGQVLLPVAKEDRPTVRVMVPLLDTANCNPANANCRWTILDPEKDDAWFALEATRPIAPGKEITLAYGSGGAPHSSVGLLNNYGFVPRVENPIDRLMLKKGGDDVFATVNEWSTSLEEDVRMMGMLGPDDRALQKALALRVRLKEAYGAGV